MRRLILGTAGHIDHGKTALVRALTGVDTDRLPEEKRRGITIDLGFANLTLDGGIEIGIVDVPGHEAFIRNMLAGATGVDIALLVVAADEGVMPQTREHLDILALLGVRALVVALTKADLVEDEWLELVTDDVKRLLADGPFAGATIVPVSAKTGAGLPDLLRTLSETAARVAERSEDDLFRLPIDRVFTVRGTGTVVTGTVWHGRVEREAVLRLLPAGESVRVRAIQSHGAERESVGAGARAALALAGTARTEIQRGDVLVSGTGWEASNRVSARLRLLPDAPPARSGQRVHFHLGTAEVMARIVPLEARQIEPGTEAWVQIRLESPIVARARDPFVIRSWSPVYTIGGGHIAEPVVRRRRRPGPETLRSLRALIDGSPAEAIEAAVALAGWKGLPLDTLPVLARVPPSLLAREVENTSAVVRAASQLFLLDLEQRASTRMLEALEQHHRQFPLSPGLPREELKQRVREAPPAFAEAILLELARDGRIQLEGHTVRLAGFVPRLSPDQQAAADVIVQEIEMAGLAAPSPDELTIRRPDVPDLIHYLVRAGRLVALPHDRYIAPEPLAAAIRQVHQQMAGRDDLTPADFRDLFGISRKYLIPLLEHLDRSGITLREGELRRLRRSDTASADRH